MSRQPDIRVSRDYKGFLPVERGSLIATHSDERGEELTVTSNNPRQVITIPLSSVEAVIEELNLAVNSRQTRIR